MENELTGAEKSIQNVIGQALRGHIKAGHSLEVRLTAEEEKDWKSFAPGAAILSWAARRYLFSR